MSYTRLTHFVHSTLSHGHLSTSVHIDLTNFFNGHVKFNYTDYCNLFSQFPVGLLGYFSFITGNNSSINEHPYR